MTDVEPSYADFAYLNRAFQLANSSTIHTSPNPCVGALIVANDRIIGEGFTQRDGGPHAEVMAFRGLKEEDQHLLPEATVYVSLEPCSIFGRTPPCCDLIIEKRIKKVVIGCIDFTKGVLGKGLERIRKAGIEVVIGVSQERAFEYSKYRQALTRKGRPYVILKQAVSEDGYVGIPQEQLPLTGKMANTISHQWRSQVDAILVGANTVAIDNPTLTARLSPGRSPARVVLDPKGRVSLASHVFAKAKENEMPTYWAVDEAFAKTCRSKVEDNRLKNVLVLTIDDQKRIHSLLKALFNFRIGRVLVEGGPTTLKHFVKANAFDEYRQWTSKVNLGPDRQGISAAFVPSEESISYQVGPDVLTISRNTPPLSNC